MQSRQLNNQDGETSRALRLLLQRACLPVFNAWRKAATAPRRKNFAGVHWSGIAQRQDFAQMYPNRSPGDMLTPNDSLRSNLDKLNPNDSVGSIESREMQTSKKVEMETPKKILGDSMLSSMMSGDQISMRVWTRRLWSLWQHMALTLLRKRKTFKDTLHTQLSPLFSRWKTYTSRQAKQGAFEDIILQWYSSYLQSTMLCTWCHVVARIRIFAGTQAVRISCVF